MFIVILFPVKNSTITPPIAFNTCKTLIWSTFMVIGHMVSQCEAWNNLVPSQFIFFYICLRKELSKKIVYGLQRRRIAMYKRSARTWVEERGASGHLSGERHCNKLPTKVHHGARRGDILTSRVAKDQGLRLHFC